MSDLVEFLLARVAEDEARATRFEPPLGSRFTHECHGTWGKARVLAECEAKRRIVEEHTPVYREESDPACGDVTSPCATLRLLALPYADHADYREEWRP